MLNKIFAADSAGAAATALPPCIGTIKQPIKGNPDPDYISTSYVERQNLTMRMSMRRFTRLTNAFSKKFENHCHALALYTVLVQLLPGPQDAWRYPAMAAGLSDRLMKMIDVIALIDARTRFPPFADLTKSRSPMKFQTDALPNNG